MVSRFIIFIFTHNVVSANNVFCNNSSLAVIRRQKDRTISHTDMVGRMIANSKVRSISIPTEKIHLKLTLQFLQNGVLRDMFDISLLTSAWQ